MIDVNRGRTAATLALPVTPKTVNTTAASILESRQCGLSCVVHFQKEDRLLGLADEGEEEEEEEDEEENTRLGDERVAFITGARRIAADMASDMPPRNMVGFDSGYLNYFSFVSVLKLVKRKQPEPR